MYETLVNKEMHTNLWRDVAAPLHMELYCIIGSLQAYIGGCKIKVDNHMTYLAYFVPYLP